MVIGDVCHYKSYGTPGGEFTSECRAAVITEIDPDDPEHVGLAAVNPTGVFFHPLAAGGVRYDEKTKAGGTWHLAPPAAGGWCSP